MKKVLSLVAVVTVALTLSGCTTETQRLDQCEAKGISRDVCYQEEKARQRNFDSNREQQRANEIKSKHYKHTDR